MRTISVLIFLLTAFTQTIGYAETIAISGLSHIHGLAVDAKNPNRLLIATHHGIWETLGDGKASDVSQARHDFMGFAPDPARAGSFFGSGHPATGGNLGLIRSDDGGKSWAVLSQGARGPVDFHALAVSGADPKRLWGVFGGLQESRDGGRTWSVVGAAPEGLIALAASRQSADRLYAATKGGLLVSTDSGRSWKAGHITRRPTTAIHAAPDGTLYAFIYGLGLVRTQEPSLAWTPVQTAFGESALFHLTVAPSDPQRLYAANDEGQLLVSRNGGTDWSPLSR